MRRKIILLKRELLLLFFFSSRRRHTRFDCDCSSDVCSSDLGSAQFLHGCAGRRDQSPDARRRGTVQGTRRHRERPGVPPARARHARRHGPRPRRPLRDDEGHDAEEAHQGTEEASRAARRLAAEGEVRAHAGQSGRQGAVRPRQGHLRVKVPRTWPAIVVSGLAATDTELIHATLATHNVAAIDEPSDDQWRIFFSAEADRDAALAALRDGFPALRLDPLDVADENWAARSQENLRAVQVGRVIVAPPWDAPITIVIRPSMGFGTGHHATTRLCIAALQRVSLDRSTVLDVGTGSAVLAIAASRLGAEEVTGIDDDQDAIQSAWDNLSLNPSAQVTLIVGLLIQSAERLRKLTNAHGRLILSGFTADEERDVLTAFGAFSVEHRGEEEGWICVTLK